MSVSHEVMKSSAARLAQLASRCASPAAASWLGAQLEALGAGGRASRADFLAAFSSAGRRLGSAPLVFADDSAALAEGVAPVLAGRGLDEVGRVALLFAELARADAGQDALVQELFYRGGAGEKQAVLRALPLLPDAGRFLEVAVEAVRSSVQTVFEAIACENPYPAEHFSDAAFNQLVLKALFIEVRAARIAGLERRAGPELLRMALGYASERRAAGRSVPADIELIAGLTRSAPR